MYTQTCKPMGMRAKTTVPLRKQQILMAIVLKKLPSDCLTLLLLLSP